MSRRSKYKSEFCVIAEKTLAQGYSQAVLAGELGVDEDTITAWKKRHAEFRRAIERGSCAGLKFWETAGIDGMMGRIQNFNAASWIFNMKNRFGWRDKRELTGADGDPLIVQIVKHANDPDPS